MMKAVAIGDWRLGWARNTSTWQAYDRSENPAFCKVVVASAVFLSCYFHCRLLPLWVECDGADRLPISRCT